MRVSSMCTLGYAYIDAIFSLSPLQVFNKLLSLASTACESKDHSTWSHLLLSVPGVSGQAGEV